MYFRYESTLFDNRLIVIGMKKPDIDTTEEQKVTADPLNANSLLKSSESKRNFDETP